MKFLIVSAKTIAFMLLSGCVSMSSGGASGGAVFEVTSDPPGAIIEFSALRDLETWSRSSVPPVGETTPATATYSSVWTAQNNGWLRVVKEGYQPSVPQKCTPSTKSRKLHFKLYPLGYSYVDEVPEQATLWRGTRNEFGMTEIQHSGETYEFGVTRRTDLSNVPIVLIKKKMGFFKDCPIKYGPLFGGFAIRQRVELDGIAVTVELVNGGYKLVCEDMNIAAAAQPNAAASALPKSSQTTEDRLRSLKRLLDDKIITTAEYEEKRSALLKDL